MGRVGWGVMVGMVVVEMGEIERVEVVRVASI